jgi:hypothetical protein
MGEKMKIAGMSVATFVGILALVFVIGLAGLGYKAFFKPKHENIERTVFENTQSYVHGKIQDLAKYKVEYNELTDPTEQAALKAVINQQFAQFDSSKIQDANLRNFLVQMRGF